jgi:hypothetical protein
MCSWSASATGLLKPSQMQFSSTVSASSTLNSKLQLTMTKHPETSFFTKSNKECPEPIQILEYANDKNTI